MRLGRKGKERVVIKLKSCGWRAGPRATTPLSSRSRQTPRFVYEDVYCARGDIENRIKELHDGLEIGRTSCCRFWAINLACSLTAAA